MSMYTSCVESEIYQMATCSLEAVVVSLHSLQVCVISVVLMFHRNKGYIYSHFWYSKHR